MSARNPGTVDRLYAINSGLAVAPSQATYTPGHPDRGPFVLSCNAYLIRRGTDWILWDTGTEDAVFDDPGGRIIAHDLRGIVIRRMRDTLADVGITPEDVGTVILSHAHFDHVGNAGMFAHAVWHLQRCEHDAMFGTEPETYGYDPDLYQSLRRSRVELADGDRDLFGDGSVRVISTPGHTPGHSSLLVRLKNAGNIILSGDVAHFDHNFRHRCVPPMNANPEQTRASMERLDALIQQESAQLWINHDIVQNMTIPHAPAFVE